MKGKRIALVGNMNNNFFAICRHLRDRGYDAHLYFPSIPEHFQPQCDTLSNNYEHYCHNIDNWISKGIYHIEPTIVKKELDNYDIVISQGDPATILNYCGIDIHIYYPYGSDVYKYAYLPSQFSWKDKAKALLGRSQISLRNMVKGTPHKYLREAIRTAKFVFAEKTNKDFEDKLFGLDLKGEFKPIPMPFIHVKEYESVLLSKSYSTTRKNELDNLRSSSSLIILYHGRQEWATYWNDFTGKNTHHLIKGFEQFIKNNPSSDAVLAMLEYGSDVEASKKLISDLQIEDRVVWLSTMLRKDLFYLISQVDICTGEFGRSYLTFGTIVEAMAMAKPVIHHRKDDLYKDVYDQLYPLYNAREPDDICKSLQSYYDNPEEGIKIGLEAKKWIEKHFVLDPVNQLIKAIESL